MTSSELSVSPLLGPEDPEVSRPVAHQYHSVAVFFFLFASLSSPTVVLSWRQIMADDFILITFTSFPLSLASHASLEIQMLELSSGLVKIVCVTLVVYSIGQ